MNEIPFKKKQNEKNIDNVNRIAKKNAGKPYGEELDELKGVMIYISESQHRFLAKTIFFNKDKDNKFKNISKLIRNLIDEFEKNGDYTNE